MAQSPSNPEIEAVVTAVIDRVVDQLRQLADSASAAGTSAKPAPRSAQRPETPEPPKATVAFRKQLTSEAAALVKQTETVKSLVTSDLARLLEVGAPPSG